MYAYASDPQSDQLWSAEFSVDHREESESQDVVHGGLTSGEFGLLGLIMGC